MSKAWALLFAGVLGAVVSVDSGKCAAPPEKEYQWAQGKNYLAEGKAKEARAVFEELLKQHPGETDLHLYLALSSLRLREVQEAEIHLRRLLGLVPDHIEARTLLGWILMESRRDYPAAVEQYSRVVRMRPDLPEAHNNLGVALKRKGELEKAIGSFNRALHLRTDYSEARSNRGWVYAEQKRWREARSDFEQALRIDPQDEGALYGLSQVLREARDYAGAQEALRKLIGRSPNFVYWLEWGQLELVRYYWVLLLVAVGFFLFARYQRIRRGSHGRGSKQEA